VEYNEEYEESVLGSILMDNTIYEKLDIVLHADHLYNPKYRKLYQEIQKMLADGEEVNIVTLSHRFPEDASTIASLTDKPVASAEWCAKQVRDMAVRRRIKGAMLELSESTKDQTKDVDELVEGLEAKISEVTERKQRTFKKCSEHMLETIGVIEKLYTNGGYLGIPSGYPRLDQFTGGFQPTEVTIIGARASIGKTALALNIAENIARKGTPVGFISLEMSASLLLQRMICGLSGVSMKTIRTGSLTEVQFEKINEAAGVIYDYPLYIYDCPGSSIMDVKMTARRMKRKEDIQLLAIDYIGLIRSKTSTARWEEVGQISAELKGLARELQIPLIVCSQVNRDAEGKEPTLANIRESGAIEQDADVVLFLHRDRMSTHADLHIAKNRNGGTGKIPLVFRPEKTRFYEEEQHGY